TITVTADAQTKVFGPNYPALTCTSSESVAFTGALVRDAGVNVGAYAIHQGTLSAGDNYAISFTGANLTITAKTITVTADAQTKEFGGTEWGVTETTSESVAFTGAVGRD